MPDFRIDHGPGYTETVLLGGTFNSPAGANTKGSYVAAVASTAFDFDELLVTIGQPNAVVSGLVDIAVGGTGSEVAIAENILHGVDARGTSAISLPVPIPAGSRISARVQDSAGSGAWPIRMTGIRHSLWAAPAGGRIVTYGALTATSKGTQIDPGAVGSTYGAWAQITAATAEDIAALQVRISGNANAVPSASAVQFFLDVGIGAPGSEVGFIVGLPFGSQTSGWYAPNWNHWFPAGIPSGSRLAVRARSNITDATDRLFGVALYGLVL